MEVFEEGEKIIQILLEAGFAIEKNKVKGPAREIQFLGVKWQDGWRQIPTEAINKSGPDVKNVLYSAAGNNGLSWSLWQKVPGETQGRPLGFWSQSYRGSEANYTPTEKEILASCEGVQAISEVIGTEAQLLLAPRLLALGWMFKGKVPSTHHATDATWSKWIALITQRARTGNPNRSGILEIIANWPEGENFGLTDEEEQEQVTRVLPPLRHSDLVPGTTRQPHLGCSVHQLTDTNVVDGSAMESRTTPGEWEWKAPYGAPRDRLHKPLKEKVGQANWLTSKLFNWPWTLLKERSSTKLAKALRLHWFVDGSQCSVGLAGQVEEGQLAA
ncbi:hypothetical protein DUI87_20602 [Hirundo rustica rustica]|uniref:Reverse transcriptase/retrotransposon-derived protein RNase H-like domain-containing protein n=1 Tax=Hirundo rustica rustica TaxID=333673 RepID=A0A3M0JRS2_HIRRU|nr:hypothetical protein DUI87_20602 [Hirundo rustica rustica]